MDNNMFEEVFISGEETLIAGDSNVHRINSYVSCVGDKSVKCLPISGARYMNDKKNFRNHLKISLEAGKYKSVYLVLGSNDVLGDLSNFYRNVSEVLDVVHEVSPSTEIVLHEILPRGPNQRRRISASQLRAMKIWIRQANNLLMDICDNIPYVRFLGCRRFLSCRHLSMDGLHLNVKGAGHCYSVIAEDCHRTPKLDVIEEDAIDDDWPTLGDVQAEMVVVNHFQLYSEVVRVKHSPDPVVELQPVMTMPCTPKKAQVICIPYRRRRNTRKRVRQQRKRWLKKKFARKVSMMSPRCPQEYVEVSLTETVAVQIPACKITGINLKPRYKECSLSNKTPYGHHVVEDPVKRIGGKVHWLSCPECRVRCSRDDFLLDHIIRRHTQNTTKITNIATSVKAVSSTDVKAVVAAAPCIKVDSGLTVCSETFDKMSPHYEGEDFVFSPSQWCNIFQLMTIGLLCGRKGLFHVMMMMVMQNVDTTKLKLLLSNDVEQNPGPVYTCGWKNCTQTFQAPKDIEMHAVEHVHKEKSCCWQGCSDDTSSMQFETLWRHVLDHVHNNKEYIPSLEEWFKFLPGGEYKENKTHLHACPLYLRSKLQLLMFDEDFCLPSKSYTAANHRLYLNKLSITNPILFKQMISNFITKRQSLGEDWSKFEVQETNASTSTISDSSVPKQDNAIIQNTLKYHFIETKPKNDSNSFFRRVKKTEQVKRKQSEIDNSQDHQSSWSINLLKNLSACDYSIKLQQSIYQTMLEKSLVDASNQSFLKLEQEAARLASVQQCTNGTFVCTVFKCFFDEKQFLYVRYVESGVYNGLMLQKVVSVLKEKYSLCDESIFLHNTLTTEDIDEMKAENDKLQLKRNRPDKVFKHSIQKSIPQALCSLNEFGECSEIKLESFIIHALPFRSKITVDTPEQIYLELKNSPVACLKTFLSDFRLNKVEQTVSSSKDILTELPSASNSLIQQSIILNCLSSDIKRKPHLFSRAARFDSNFFINRSHATSLRNQILQLYLQRRFQELTTFFGNYFPELNLGNNLKIESQSDHVAHPKRFKKSVSKVVKSLVITKNDLEKQLQSVEPISEVNIYEGYSISLLEHGTLKIQYYDESTLVCLMNDYDETDGSFRKNDFVYTVKQKQEAGDYFYCSCKIYRTLINIKDCTSFDEGTLVLDSTGENCVTCIHCMFMKERVLPEIGPGKENETQSRLNLFIQKALKDKGKDILELSRNKDTHKYSIITEDEDRPSFVHLSFNRSQGNYVVSCNNGRCLSVRGHKRSVSTLASAVLCKHLTVFRDHSEYWQEFVQSNDETNTDNQDCVDFNSNIAKDMNFDESSGLWNFKCRSTHSPNKKDSPFYKANVIRRDSWNDNNLERSDGCLKGPILVSDIPDSNCECGSGWVKKTDGECIEEGFTRQEKSRFLIIYTSLAPVKCEVHTRLCSNPVSPCKLLWDEGQRDSIHVLSRDTAAGDEIGWEFVSMVMKSGCTFSAYCQLKNDLYQVRDSHATFMDSTVFINWWFSWAANMKIDFRKPCNVCGFEPKRLCCDGTRVGVGFRHATFEEINKSDPNNPVESTLHRRMDRCFLRNMNGIDKQQMIKNRETLDYLARHEIGEINDKERLENNELNHRINSLKVVLPEEFLPSFERFFTMVASEKKAYARVLKMLSTTASVTSLLPPSFCLRLQQLIHNPNTDCNHFKTIVNEMRSYAPELRDLICESKLCNEELIPNDILLLIQYLINESLEIQVNEPEAAFPQPGTYNPPKFGRAYYFNESGSKLRNVRKFTIDEDKNAKRNVDHDDNALEFERCQKLYSKVQNSAHGTSNLFLWFCADHGHCYGFHMTGAEGRKDPSASLYSHLEKPPQDVFYDFACNLQEYCLNRESGFYKDVRFFHDIFHSYAHKCSCAFKSSRLQGFESVNSEICEQFNSFIQCIKRSARQMSQSHFCFYLQFFLHEWNEKKSITSQKKLRIALAGMNRP